MLPVIQLEGALESPDVETNLLTNRVRTIKLLQPLRACVGERELHSDSGLIRAAHAENHDAALNDVVRGDGKSRNSLNLTKSRNGRGDYREKNDECAHGAR